MKTELKNIRAWGRLHYDFLYRNNRTVIFEDITVFGVEGCDPFDADNINPLMESGHMKGFSFDIRERGARLFRLIE